MLYRGRQEGETLKDMNQRIAIGGETDADGCTITEVTAAAFKTLEVSNRTEQFVIGALGK